jgi:hypothetical protein
VGLQSVLTSDEVRWLNGKSFLEIPQEMRERMASVGWTPEKMQFPEDDPLEVAPLEDSCRIVDSRPIDAEL